MNRPATNMNRREFSRMIGAGSLAAWSLGNWSLPAFGKAATEGLPLHHRGAFLVNGKPVFLIAGSIDYFRCPPELWRDRLLKAKRGGLNCIASYIAWNFHEVADGHFDFTGARDLGRFIDLCGELGLLFYARVGPFICAEWDGAGHPAWLIGKDDIQFRAMHGPTLKYVRRWFEHLLPVLVKRQVTRGGPVVLIQQENEYHYADRPDGHEYQATLVRWMRELGVEVTISDCNLSNARADGSLATINGFNVGRAREFHRDRAGQPVLISELYVGFLECWGQSTVPAPPAQLHRQLMELLSIRAMHNYFMHHGGTNFGFTASSSWKTDDAFVTTCYYPLAPVAEGGMLNETYFAAKAADQLAASFQPFFCEADFVEPPAEADGPIRLSALRSPQGTMLFVLPKGDGLEKAGALRLPEGGRVELADSAARPVMVPFGFEAAPRCRIDWANATWMGIAGPESVPCLLFRGESGRRGRASINGHLIEFGFGTAEPTWTNVEGVRIVGLAHELADRAWLADGRWIIGPAYVAERRGKRHECGFNPGVTTVQVIEADGRLRRHTVTVPPLSEDRTPLTSWRAHPLPEVRGGGAGWQAIPEPRPLEQLGVYEGYAWYRARVHSEQARRSTLMFTRAGDRFHVFLNGQVCGVWGRGAGATRDPLPIELAAGDNDLVLLCDNMGHSSEGRAQERKGILGPVWIDAQPRELGEPERFTPGAAVSDNYEFATYRKISAPEGRFTGFAWNIRVGEGERLLLTLRALPHYAWIRLNGRLVGEHGGDLSLVNGFSFKEFVLPSTPANTDSAQLEVVLFGGDLADPTEHVRLFACPDRVALVDWRFKAWESPRQEGRPVAGEPVWWTCDMPEPKKPGPHFLHLDGLHKGHVWLNGRAAGRYWEIGPQKTLYLPEPWWKPSNQCCILDEQGRSPAGTFLARGARVPVVWRTR